MARTLSIHRVILRAMRRRSGRISAWDDERRADEVLLLQDEKKKNAEGGKERRADEVLLLQDEKKKNAEGGKERRAAPGKGRMAVYVGEEERRYVIPTSYVCAPEFVPVMEMAREEYGYQQPGGLRIPCGVDEFDDVLRRTKEAAAAGGGCCKRKRAPLISRVRRRLAPPLVFFLCTGYRSTGLKKASFQLLRSLRRRTFVNSFRRLAAAIS